jgi:hypothetical protein
LTLALVALFTFTVLPGTVVRAHQEGHKGESNPVKAERFKAAARVVVTATEARAGPSSSHTGHANHVDHVEERNSAKQPAEFVFGIRNPSSSEVAGQAASDDAAAVEAWLKGYDVAFIAKDLEKLATFYHPDVTL